MPTPLRVLIVDESGSRADRLLLRLRDAGFEVSARQIVSVAELSEPLDEQPWDAVFLRPATPLDTATAADLIARRDTEVPLIVVSDACGDESVAAALNAGAVACLGDGDRHRVRPILERELRAATIRRARRAAQAELSARERLLDAFFVGSPAGMAIVDDQLRYVRVNRALAGMHRRDLEAHAGRRLRDVIPGLADTVEPILQGVLDTGRAAFGIEVSGSVPDPDGEPGHWLASYFPLAAETGSPRRVGLVVLDTTDWKRAELALGTSQQRYRQLFENSLDGILLTRPDGEILAANEAACRLFGYSEEELRRLGRSMLMDLSDPRLAAGLAEREETGRFRGELTVIRKDGARLPVELSSNVFVAPDGSRQTSMFIRDITGRREAEDALRESTRQLRALWARLEGLREEERTRISRELHDAFGQMLTSIKLDLRWLERRLEQSPDPERAGPLLDKLVATSDLVDETIASIQRIAAELRPGILEDLGLMAALSHEAARFERTTGVTCRLAVPGDEPRVPPDVATALFRVFQEALTNVARHARATEVAAVFENDEAGWTLSVCDNGRGITDEALRDSRSLGLLGMKERAALVGGEVAVERRAGGGTVVSIRAPGSSRPPADSTGP